MLFSISAAPKEFSGGKKGDVLSETSGKKEEKGGRRSHGHSAQIKKTTEARRRHRERQGPNLGEKPLEKMTWDFTFFKPKKGARKKACVRGERQAM